MDMTMDQDKLEETPSSSSLRKGKWTSEEENYANKIIAYFNQGLLRIPTGTTLRTYLSDKLQWLVFHFLCDCFDKYRLNYVSFLFCIVIPCE